MKKLSSPILAKGEVTGHAHILDGNVIVYEDDEGYKEFNNKIDIPLKHEEHNPITFSPDEWISGIVEEYDHFTEEAREIAD